MTANPLSYLAGSPLQQPLPEGLQADPTYLAFLRGAGMDETSAWTTAIQHVAAIKANYQTQVQRDPEMLRSANEDTNQDYLNNGGFANGRRLEDLARNRVTDQQRLQDLSTQQATGISDAQTQLRQQLSELGRNNVDQQGALQGRQDATNNQDRYIAAVRDANQPAQPAVPTPAVPAGAPGAPAAHPAIAAGAQLAAMAPGAQSAFRQFVTGLAQQRTAKAGATAAANAAGARG